MGSQDTVINKVQARQVRLFGQDDDPIDSDSVHDALRVIDVLHHQTHNGRVFQASAISAAVANNDVFEFLLRTDDTRYCHLRAQLMAAGDAYLHIFESPTSSADGSAVSAVNKNRLSSESAKLSVFSGPTVTVDGTQLHEEFVPGGHGNQGSGGRANFEEFVLKRDVTDYLTRATNKSGGAADLGLLLLTWYEVGN